MSACTRLTGIIPPPALFRPSGFAQWAAPKPAPLCGAAASPPVWPTAGRRNVYHASLTVCFADRKQVVGSERQVSGIILAGGASRRMGQPKALMPWDGGLLIDAVIRALGSVVEDILVVAKDTAPFVGRGARVIPDRATVSHPWAGLSTGLLQATHEVSFVCACDMPWLHPALIRYLCDALGGSDAAIPQGPHGMEPLHAVYTRRCVPRMARNWRAGARTFPHLLEGLAVRMVTSSELDGIEGWERSFVNLNTPTEYGKIHRYHVQTYHERSLKPCSIAVRGSVYTGPLQWSWRESSS